MGVIYVWVCERDYEYAQLYERNSKIRKKSQNGALVKALFGKGDPKNG